MKDIPLTFEAHLNFTPRQSVHRIETTPQSGVIRSVYQHTHSFIKNGTGYYVDNYIGVLWNKVALDDRGEARVLVEEKPETLGEEELLRICQLRGSLTTFAWSYLDHAVFPPEVKAKYSTTKEHLCGDESFDADLTLWRWAKEHPNEDAPMRLPEELRLLVGRVHQRATNLIEFYNLKKPFKRTAYGLAGWRSEEYSILDGEERGNAQMRLSIVKNYIDLFGTKKAYQALEKAESHK